MNVHIKCPDGDPAKAEITASDGTALRVAAVNVSMRAGEPTIAELEFCDVSLDTDAQALVSEEALRQLAESHGYDLVPK